MSGHTNTGRVVTRHKTFDEVTVPYPDGVPLSDDDTTVVADPAEMELTAQAMMFVDTGIVLLKHNEQTH